jgi:hypothetical protein
MGSGGGGRPWVDGSHTRGFVVGGAGGRSVGAKTGAADGSPETGVGAGVYAGVGATRRPCTARVCQKILFGTRPRLERANALESPPFRRPFRIATAYASASAEASTDVDLEIQHR